MLKDYLSRKSTRGKASYVIMFCFLDWVLGVLLIIASDLWEYVEHAVMDYKEWPGYHSSISNLSLVPVG